MRFNPLLSSAMEMNMESPKRGICRCPSDELLGCVCGGPSNQAKPHHAVPRSSDREGVSNTVSAAEVSNKPCGVSVLEVRYFLPTVFRVLPAGEELPFNLLARAGA